MQHNATMQKHSTKPHRQVQQVPAMTVLVQQTQVTIDFSAVSKGFLAIPIHKFPAHAQSMHQRFLRRLVGRAVAHLDHVAPPLHELGEVPHRAAAGGDHAVSLAQGGQKALSPPARCLGHLQPPQASSSTLCILLWSPTMFKQALMCIGRYHGNDMHTVM